MSNQAVADAMRSMASMKEIAAMLECWKHDPFEFVVQTMGVTPSWQQKKILQAIAKEGAHVSVRSGHGIGKLQKYETIVPTPCGERRWGDLTVGDEVFGKDGKPVKIIATKHYKQIPMYRVTFDDRSYCDVSSGHLWNVRGRNERRTTYEGWRTYETIDILERGVKRCNGVALARQWEIPKQEPVEFYEREIDLHPYVMGVWLGDGSRRTPSYTKTYPELNDKIRSLGYEVHTGQDGKKNHILNVAHLFKDGVFQRRSFERYIPDEYKYNTVENRYALFCGLCDTDGEVHKSGSIGYSSTSKRLADDMIWLARSLGYKAMMQPTIKNGWYPDEDGERVECRDCYRVTINCPVNPFTLKHRRDAYKPSEERYLTRWIDSIEPIENADGMCITVENEDGLYLANDFIVTHNSTVESWIILWFLIIYSPCRIPITAPSSHQLFDILWADLLKWREKMVPTLKNQIIVASERAYIAGCQQSRYAVARTARRENPEALQGFHETPLLFILEEASGIDEKIFEVAEGALSTPGARILMCSNPTRTEGYFYRSHTTERKFWDTFSFKSNDSPFVDPKWCERMKDRYGEDSPIYRVRVLGEFDSTEDNLIPIAIIESAVDRDVQYPSAQRIAGLDVARFGDDSTALVVRQGGEIIYMDQWQGLDLMQTTGKIVELYNKDKGLPLFNRVHVDSIGLGSGVVDRLVELGVPTMGVNVSESTSSSDRFVRLRDELWWKARDFFFEKQCRIDGKQKMLNDFIGEATSVRFSYTSSGKIKIESKADMKKRINASPNLADAFCLTLAEGILSNESAIRSSPQRRNIVTSNPAGWV